MLLYKTMFPADIANGGQMLPNLTR